ncbi:hypothetical protein [Sphingobacterium prati]|uniref:hypothetical protein n=1 Tax=Sphingobacterium prati TaxID=2737006 RepID=UPI0015531FA1|nr:hypothetical protein [Sphingobacterium prati]NPE45856.1 hypothetical protein [Sphingobacterium prati]
MNWFISSSLILLILVGCKKDSYDFGEIENNFTQVTIMTQEKVFDNFLHCAFTDLIHYNGNYFLAFRKGSDHGASRDGTVVILKSGDLKSWDKINEYRYLSHDLRDPKFFVDNSGHLLFSCVGFLYAKSDYLLDRSFLVFDLNSEGNGPLIKQNVGFWPWKIEKNNNSYYTIGYSTSKNIINLYEFSFMPSFRTLCNFNPLGTSLTEAVIKFYDNHAYIVVRSKENLYIGIIEDLNDLCKINWKSFPIEDFGGPNFVKYKNTLLIAGRENIGKGNNAAYNRTVLLKYDIVSNELSRAAVLDSQGDTGYPGMLLNRDTLTMSYYSTTGEDKAAIYLSKVKINF